jgi:hypothetical protein
VIRPGRGVPVGVFPQIELTRIDGIEKPEGNAMTRKMWRGPLLALAAAALGTASLAAGEQPRQPTEVLSFGTLQSPKPEEARKAAQAWLVSVGKTDEASQKQFAIIWSDAERPLLDKVADTLILGDPRAAKLLADVRNPAMPAPTDVPALLKDTQVNSYLRTNLAVAYAQGLAHRKIYDEALRVLSLVKPEQTVDPATYLFNRAVAEYCLMMKKESTDSILRLLEDVTDSPERYRQVAALMSFDMMTWQDKDLDWVSRKMGIIHNRLELNRGGQNTQKIQKEVLVRLDEMIKEKENQAKSQGQGQGQGQGEGQGPNDGNCPSGGEQQGLAQGNRPNDKGAADSALPNAVAKGEADAKAQAEKIEKFGSPNEKERTEARAAALKESPPEFKEAVEAYLEQLQKDSNPKK